MENDNAVEKQNTEISDKKNQNNNAETVKAQYTEVRQTVETSADGDRAVKTVEAVAAEATVVANEVKTFAVRETRIVTEAPAQSFQVEKNGESAFVKRAGKQLENARDDAKKELGSGEEGNGRANGQGGYGRGPVRRGNSNFQNKKGRANDNRGGGNNQNFADNQQISGSGNNQPRAAEPRNQNRDGRDARDNREGRQDNGQENQSMREKFSKNERYGRNGRENQEGGYRRRGSKNETVEDIRKDIEGIEKEIELEIADISVMRLGM